MTQDRKFWTRCINYFAKSEFPHDPDKVSLDLVQKLDQLRGRATDLMGRECPIVVHVACGKPGVHAEDSYHYPEAHGSVCQACDFHFVPGRIPFGVQAMLINEISFGGIGYYPDWDPCPGWHVDIRKGTPVYWTRIEGNYIYSLGTMMQEVTDDDVLS